eukprot:3192364-Heterocapsa_arctica.AAC.1
MESGSGKTVWTMCEKEDCYRCMTIRKAVADFDIPADKGETTSNGGETGTPIGRTIQTWKR